MGAFLGLMGGGISAFSNWLNNQNQITAANQTREFNRRMMEEQMNWSSREATTAYNRQRQLYNEFYSPEATVRQLETAGLSQGLLYGMGGNGGSASMAPQANSTGLAQAVTPQQQTLVDAQIMSLMANARKTAAEAEEHEAGAEEKRGNLTVQEETKLNLKKEREEIDQRITNEKKQFDVMCADIERINSERDKNYANKDLMEAQTAYQQSQKTIQEKLANQQLENLKEDVKRMKAEEAKLYAEAKKANVEATTLQRQQDDIVKSTHLAFLKAAFEYKYITPQEAKRVAAISDIEEQRDEIKRILTAAYKRTANSQLKNFIQNFRDLSILFEGRYLIKD